MPLPRKIKQPPPAAAKPLGDLYAFFCRGVITTPPQKGADRQIRPAPSIDGKYSTATSCKFGPTVSGGAYQDAREVSPEWNARPKHWSLPEFRGRKHPASPSTLFFHIFSLAREKIWPSETTGSCKVDTTSQSRLRRASSPGRGAFSAAAGDRSLRPFGPALFTQGSFCFIGNARRRCPSGRGGGRGCV